jgi:hypothetical protein
MKFLQIWYKKKKIALHDMSRSKQEGPMEESKEVTTESEAESEA